MKTVQLEAKYIVKATELRKMKDGRYGKNMWFWIVKLWLKSSVKKRLARLNDDYAENEIGKSEYEAYKDILTRAL